MCGDPPLSQKQEKREKSRNLESFDPGSETHTPTSLEQRAAPRLEERTTARNRRESRWTDQMVGRTQPSRRGTHALSETPEITEDVSSWGLREEGNTVVTSADSRESGRGNAWRDAPRTEAHAHLSSYTWNRALPV